MQFTIFFPVKAAMGISAHFLEITGALRVLLKCVRGPYGAYWNMVLLGALLALERSLDVNNLVCAVPWPRDRILASERISSARREQGPHAAQFVIVRRDGAA